MAIHLSPTQSIADLFSLIDIRASELDYSEASMQVVEAMLDDASKRIAAISKEDRTRLIEGFGWYILEVGRKMFGGRYAYYHQENAPVLVSGEPTCSIALITFPRVAGRLSGDLGDNIPFFFEGFSSRAKAATVGDKVTFI